jgi:hypothetical protein
VFQAYNRLPLPRFSGNEDKFGQDGFLLHSLIILTFDFVRLLRSANLNPSHCQQIIDGIPVRVTEWTNNAAYQVALTDFSFESNTRSRGTVISHSK